MMELASWTDQLESTDSPARRACFHARQPTGALSQGHVSQAFPLFGGDHSLSTPLRLLASPDMQSSSWESSNQATALLWQETSDATLGGQARGGRAFAGTVAAAVFVKLGNSGHFAPLNHVSTWTSSCMTWTCRLAWSVGSRTGSCSAPRVISPT